ncbi:MAG: bacillithiol system redox-active protein YtxJ [Candidatus Latescibacteria bacterium]|jgi:bacillithiol system protein YtxJ|nr:bacillithiol system redox-active protein YtxJ [Candidatus Latescibacterota bacterium]
MQSINLVETITSLNKILNNQYAILMKHSTKCPVSQMAKIEVEKFAGLCNNRIKLYIIDVLTNADVSYEIEKRTQVKHESPQVFIFKDGKVIWHASHGRITVKAMREACECLVQE